MECESDPAKAGRNASTHGVTFEAAESVFGDPLSLTVDDPEHSADEYRFWTIGMSDTGRVLVVVHTSDEPPRIISAREATAGERRDYEEGES